MHCATLLLLSVAQATEVPSTIDQDATWSPADSPYRVSQDVTVAAGATLTIEAGVSVELDPDCSILVEGGLQARGEGDIVFSLSPDAKGSWGSLVLSGSEHDAVYEGLDSYASGSILEGCVFEHGSRALRLTGASPLVKDCEFSDNSYEPAEVETAGGAALYIEEGSLARIQGCSFQDNHVGGYGQGGAIYVNDADPIIQDCVFEGNSSIYGGALTSILMAAPIVGCHFQDNEVGGEGGAISLLSAVPAVLNNQVLDNSAWFDGGGIHVCVTCDPHAAPVFMDNAITGNQALYMPGGGFGAAWLRGFYANTIHDNLAGDEPGDFAWNNKWPHELPEWMHSPDISGNYWGTTDVDEIEEAIYDGLDDEELGVVAFEPVLQSAPSQAQTRVVVSTRRLHYDGAGDAMPVFLTLYNPGAAREVELLLLLEYGERRLVQHREPIGFPGETEGELGQRLSLPANGVWFGKLLEPSYASDMQPAWSAWHAALFDADSGERIGIVSTARFDLGED